MELNGYKSMFHTTMKNGHMYINAEFFFFWMIGVYYRHILSPVSCYFDPEDHPSVSGFTHLTPVCQGPS